MAIYSANKKTKKNMLVEIGISSQMLTSHIQWLKVGFSIESKKQKILCI